MSKEHWIVKSNAEGHLFLPKLGLSFKSKNNEKELCFLTGKSVADLEKDPEIISSMAANNLITVSKETISEDNENLINEINELKKMIREGRSETNTQPSIPQQPFDFTALINAIKTEIKTSVGSANVSGQAGENIVLSDDSEEKAREEAIKQLIFKGKDTSVKNFDKLGSETQVENESDGNENLLGDIPDF